MDLDIEFEAYRVITLGYLRDSILGIYSDKKDTNITRGGVDSDGYPFLIYGFPIIKNTNILDDNALRRYTIFKLTILDSDSRALHKIAEDSDWSGKRFKIIAKSNNPTINKSKLESAIRLMIADLTSKTN